MKVRWEKHTLVGVGGVGHLAEADVYEASGEEGVEAGRQHTAHKR